MDSRHPALGHQKEVALELAKHFSQVRILSANGPAFSHVNPSPAKVSNLNWQYRSRLSKVIVFYIQALWILLSFRPHVVFSHMTTKMSLLLSPLTLIFKIRHYLWYAHKSNSKILALTHRLITGIITSTQGSCPLTGDKIHVIGQGIDTKLFEDNRDSFRHFKKLLYVGRLDPSKNIDILIETLFELRNKYGDITLDMFGAGLRNESNNYINKLIDSHSKEIKDFIFIYPPVSRTALREIFRNHDLFLHAYRGSLDKVLVEATLSQLPVITLNDEYNLAFRVERSMSEGSLYHRVVSWLESENRHRQRTIQSRFEIAQREHSLDNWINQVKQILLEGQA